MPTPPDRDVEVLLAYLEGRATPEEVEALERRLREEPGLAESLAVQARMSAMLGSMAREQSRIESARPRLPRRTLPQRTNSAAWTIGLAAAAVFALVALFAVLSGDPEPSRTAERRRVEKKAEDGLKEVERERARLLAQPVSPEKKPETITEEERKAALAALEERKRRIEDELRAAVVPGPKETKPLEPAPGPGPTVVPEKKPEAPTRTSIAKVVKGDAFLGGERKPVGAGQEILAGQAIETGAGPVEILWPDQTRMELGAETVVKELRADGGKRVTIEKGSVRADVKPQPKGQPLVVESTQGEATVLGTVLKVAVAPDGTTLEVEEGKVRFRNKLSGKSVEVVGGHFAVAAPGIEFSALALPSTLYAATFDDGKAPGWTFSAKYPWTLRSALTSPVYPLNDPKATRSELTVMLASKVWQDGVFEMDARLEEIDANPLGSFLVFLRYRDQDNNLWLEYMLKGGTWSVALLQLNGGTLTTIASGPAAALELGRSYRLRLEAKDDEVRALVDGKELLRGKTTVLAPGRLAFCPMSSRVTFDNIRVSTVPLRPRAEKPK